MTNNREHLRKKISWFDAEPRTKHSTRKIDSPTRTENLLNEMILASNDANIKD